MLCIFYVIADHIIAFAQTYFRETLRTIDLSKYEGQKICRIFQTTIVNDIHEIHHFMKHSMNDSFE